MTWKERAKHGKIILTRGQLHLFFFYSQENWKFWYPRLDIIERLNEIESCFFTINIPFSDQYNTKVKFTQMWTKRAKSQNHVLLEAHHQMKWPFLLKYSCERRFCPCETQKRNRSQCLQVRVSLHFQTERREKHNALVFRGSTNTQRECPVYLQETMRNAEKRQKSMCLSLVFKWI